MAWRARTRASHAVEEASSAGTLTPGAYRRAFAPPRDGTMGCFESDPQTIRRADARPGTTEHRRTKADRGDDERPQERARAQPRRAAVVRRRVPARQARQGWRLRAHEAEERA